MTMSTQVHEPHKIKTVRLLTWPKLEKRKRLLADAGFNVFNLSPDQVSFDMCSLGTSAFSQKQLAGQYIGDEAYAGSRNFVTLEESARQVLGVQHICPTHNLLGALKLVVHTMATPGTNIVGNSTLFKDLATLHKVGCLDVRDKSQEIFTGDVDLAALKIALEGGAKMVAMQAFSGGQHPFSLANLMQVKELADGYDALLVLDASRIIENAWYMQQHEAGLGKRTIAGLVKETADLVRILIMDGAQDPKANTGGFIGVNQEDDYVKLMNEVVVYEGLHTYGGMAGRTMEVLSRGLSEMCSEAEVQWVMQQTLAFTARLRAGGVPLERGCDGAYIQADKFLPHLAEHQQDAFSANLYLVSGVRAIAQGRVGDDLLVPVQIPRLAMTNEQLDQVADAIIHLYRQADQVPNLHRSEQGSWRDQMRYRSIFANLDNFDFDTAPFNIHTIEYVGLLTKEKRQRAILEAGYNTFLLRSEDVTIDLLTDSGTTAMSTDQWAAYDAARASATTSEEYHRFVEILQEVLGYEHIIPTHQGRAAEHILSQIMIKPGQFVPGNMYFTTTKLHQEMAGGIFADIIVDEAHQPDSQFPWKGNIDLDKLRVLVEEHGAEKMAYISFEHSVNMAGGQPVSMDNMKDVYDYCAERDIPVFFDATRMTENAYMIQQRDERYHQTPVRDIIREMMLYGDGCTVSGKKDYLINIGGILAFRDNSKWCKQAEELLRIYEGNVTDGGLPAADLAAISRGVVEMLDDRYIRARVQQTEYLGDQLIKAGVPIVTPAGSHAIFLDAKRFLPHVPQEAFPAQRLAAEIYVETGVRPMERGNVSKGRNPKTGENYCPALELVRLTIPRRVYTNDHMKAVADGIIRLYHRRHEIGGLKFTYEPERLRFFQARFEAQDRWATTPEKLEHPAGTSLV